MIRKLRPRFLYENLEKNASMALETRTYFYDSIRHSIVDPPTLAPLPREHSPERRRARDIRSGESDRLRVRVVRAMLCGLWTLRRNVDKSADAELCVRHEISAKFASDGRNLREEICGAPKKILAHAKAAEDARSAAKLKCCENTLHGISSAAGPSS